MQLGYKVDRDVELRYRHNLVLSQLTVDVETDKVNKLSIFIARAKKDRAYVARKSETFT